MESGVLRNNGFSSCRNSHCSHDPLILFRRLVSAGLLQGDRNIFFIMSALSATDNTRDRSGKDAEEQFNGDVVCRIVSCQRSLTKKAISRD